MDAKISPYLTKQDAIVLENLFTDVTAGNKTGHDDGSTVTLLENLGDVRSAEFEPTVFTTDFWLPPFIRTHVLPRYVAWGSRVVRRPTDVVFLTHIILYFTTSVPSALFLYFRFSWVHGVVHWLMQLFYAGAFTLMLHNHIHNKGVLSASWGWLDAAFPYVLEPLMGHTWDSYYYHHVKHHHAEGNGPDDLSSTIRYQRDSVRSFAAYVARFIALVWIELPIYFVRKGRYALAMRALGSELGSYLFFYLLVRYDFRPTLFVFLLPLLQMRIGMMIGNWGQHAFVDDVEPESAYRSSITLVDVTTNRHCFNDGYHTSHHLNPRRHWRDHPHAFVKAKELYSSNHALVFHNIDYLMLTITLLRKDYDHLVKCLVPMGDQIGLNKEELVAMLKTKTRRFTEEEIRQKFHDS